MSASKLKWRKSAEQARLMLCVCRVTTERYHGVGETPMELYCEVMVALQNPENRTVRVIDVVEAVVREFKAKEGVK